MTDTSDDLLLPIRTLRALHSCYIDLVMTSRQDIAEWLLDLTERQMKFEFFALAVHAGTKLRVSYFVVDDESDAWFRISGLHSTGEWLLLTGANVEDAGVTVEWLRLNERAIVEQALNGLEGAP